MGGAACLIYLAAPLCVLDAEPLYERTLEAAAQQVHRILGPLNALDFIQADEQLHDLEAVRVPD